MNPHALVVAAALALGDGSDRDLWRPEPLAARNQHPLSLLFLDLPIAGAGTVPEGRFEAALRTSYTVVSQSGFGARDEAVFDGEFARATGSLRFGAADGLELSIDVPVAYASGGFLDHFIDEYHSLLGLPQTVPEGVPENFFDAHAARDGREYFRVEPYDVALGDIGFGAKVRVLDEAGAPLTLALRGGLEPPTGSVSRGFGSDTWDTALGVSGQRSFGEWTAFLDVGVGLPDVFDEFRGPRPQPFLSVSPAIRLDVGRWGAFIVELDYGTNVIPDADVPELSRNQLQVDVGAEIYFGERTIVEIGFAEDLAKKTSPDITGMAGLRVRF